MNSRFNRFCGVYGLKDGGSEAIVRAMGAELEPAALEGAVAAAGPLAVFARNGVVTDGMPSSLWVADGDDEFRENPGTREGCSVIDLPDWTESSRLERMLARIPGGWALAGLDASGNLLLARDRAGRRELYYTFSGRRLCFSTGMGALLRVRGRQPRVHADKISEYMAFRMLAGPETLFQGVYRVLPGEALVFAGDKPQSVKTRYWIYGWKSDVPKLTLGDAAHELERRLAASVRGAMENRRVFLMQSAGIDSNAILAAASRSIPGHLLPVTTAPDRMEHSEAESAERLAYLLGCRKHDVVPVTARDLVERMFEAHGVMEEPIAHVVSILHAVAYEAKKNAYDGFLTGEAADVVIGNDRAGKYACALQCPSYVPMGWIVRRWADFTGMSRLKTAAGILGDDWRQFVCRSRMMLEETRLQRLVKNYDRNFPTRLAVLEGYDYADRLEGICRYFFESAVHCCKSFAVLAAQFEIEPLFAYLREPLFDWLMCLRPEHRFHGGRGKYVLRKAMEHNLPRQSVWGAKRAGEQPLGEWLRCHPDLKALALGLAHPDTHTLEFFNPDELSKTLRRHFERECDESVAIWQVLSLEIWHRLMIEGQNCEQARSEMTSLGRDRNL